jgi:WD40 repeat protein
MIEINNKTESSNFVQGDSMKHAESLRPSELERANNNSREKNPPQNKLSSQQFLRHRGPITSTAAVIGSRKVVTGAYDGAVGVFDLDSGGIQLLGYHRHLVNQVTVDSFEGRWAASCSSDYTIHLWDLATGERVRILRGHADDVEDFVFVDETTGISASRDQRIFVWDLQSGAIRQVLEAHDKDVLSLAYHDGLLYSSGDDKTLRVWNVASAELVKTIGPFDLETDTCAIDPVNNRIVVGCDDGVVRIFDVESGELISEIAAHSSGIKKVAVSVNGDILSAAYDQRIIIWSGATLEKKLELENVMHKWERSFSFSPDGSTIFAGTFDGTLLEWDTSTGKLLSEARADGNGNACFNRVAASPKGTAVTVADDGWIRMAEFSNGSAGWGEQIYPESGRMLMNAVAIDTRGEFVVSGAHDQKLHMYDLAEGQLINHREKNLGEGPINFIDIATQKGYENHAFVACYSGRIVCVSPECDVRASFMAHEGAVKSVRLHPAEKLGVSCSADGSMSSWTFDGEIISHYLGHTAIINDVAFSFSGKRIASVSRDFTLKVYDFAEGTLLESFSLGRRSLKSVCFVSEDLIFVGDYWGGLIRVDLKTGEVQKEKIAENGISSLASCGPLLLATSYDGSVSAIDPKQQRVAHRIEAMQQNLSTLVKEEIA